MIGPPNCVVMSAYLVVFAGSASDGFAVFTAEGTFDAAISHTGYMTNPIVINTIRNVIAK